MLRSTRLSLFCLSIAPLLVAQTIEPEKLREDFRILRSALEEGHPGIYRYTPKAELDSVFDATAARLDRPMTALEFYRVLAPVVGALKCGHTSMGLSEELQKRAIPLFPAEVRVLDHKVYVFRDYSGTGGLAAAEIQSVNGVPAGRILQTMLTVEHGDGESTTAGPWRIGHGGTFARDLYMLAGIESPFRIRYVLAGKTSEATIEGIPGDQRVGTRQVGAVIR